MLFKEVSENNAGIMEDACWGEEAVLRTKNSVINFEKYLSEDLGEMYRLYEDQKAGSIK